jgi:cobalt/nickel transport system permease protein
MRLSKTEKAIVCLSVMFATFFISPMSVNAMHIMEGYLPAAWCAAWGALCLPFLIIGVISIKRTVQKSRRALILLAMSGAFVFVLSSLKIPSLTGSCSHMTGTGLAAILFGFSSASVLGCIVLVFQAILLAHGGLTTLGANAFGMAIAGPLFACLLFMAGKKLRVNKMASIFAAAMLGDLLAYCVTSLQLALAYPGETGVAASMAKFLSVFALTQIPLAIAEGFFLFLVIMGMESFAKRELAEISFAETEVVKP